MARLVERWLAETPAPRPPRRLLDLVERVRPAPKTVGADLGAYSGTWAARIAELYDCRVLAVDIALSPLKASEPGTAVVPVNANLQQLPFRTESLSLVWCRDTLSMVPDVGAACGEIARVLHAGSGGVIYSAVTTPRLEPLERAEMMEALAMPAWWARGREPVDSAIATAGLDHRLGDSETVKPIRQPAVWATGRPSKVSGGLPAGA